jgi:hypothetical protein
MFYSAAIHRYYQNNFRAPHSVNHEPVNNLEKSIVSPSDLEKSIISLFALEKRIYLSALDICIVSLSSVEKTIISPFALERSIALSSFNISLSALDICTVSLSALEKEGHEHEKEDVGVERVLGSGLHPRDLHLGATEVGNLLNVETIKVARERLEVIKGRLLELKGRFEEIFEDDEQAMINKANTSKVPVGWTLGFCQGVIITLSSVIAGLEFWTFPKLFEGQGWNLGICG